MVDQAPVEDYKTTYSQVLGTTRLWLDLYNIWIRPVSPFESLSRPVIEHSLLHRTLPDEVLLEVLIRLSPYTLGKAVCVCRKWRYTLRHPLFWRGACLDAWQMIDARTNEELLFKRYWGSWLKMWIMRPRLRFDGIYVSRNTYVPGGVAGTRNILAVYYRYLRFFPTGKFLYKLTFNKPNEVARIMNKRARKNEIYGGKYTMQEAQVEIACAYPYSGSVLKIQLGIGGTVPGANNILDILKLVTGGLNEVDDDIRNMVEGEEDDEMEGDYSNSPAMSHKRGLAPFFFVPFEEVEKSALNF